MTRRVIGLCCLEHLNPECNALLLLLLLQLML